VNNENENNEININDRIEKGKFYFVNEKYEFAIREFKEVLKVNKNLPDVFYNLGISYESSNDFDKAKENYLKALELDPEHKMAKDHLDRMLDK